MLLCACLLAPVCALRGAALDDTAQLFQVNTLLTPTKSEEPKNVKNLQTLFAKAAGIATAKEQEHPEPSTNHSAQSGIRARVLPKIINAAVSSLDKSSQEEPLTQPHVHAEVLQDVEKERKVPVARKEKTKSDAKRGYGAWAVEGQDAGPAPHAEFRQPPRWVGAKRKPLEGWRWGEAARKLSQLVGGENRVIPEEPGYLSGDWEDEASEVVSQIEPVQDTIQDEPIQGLEEMMRAMVEEAQVTDDADPDLARSGDAPTYAWAPVWYWVPAYDPNAPKYAFDDEGVPYKLEDQSSAPQSSGASPILLQTAGADHATFKRPSRVIPFGQHPAIVD